jgi:2-methylisocitrate lyase-like PEP mutase family enzyme
MTTRPSVVWSQGRPDAPGSRDVALAHLRDMVVTTDLPMSADFENGYARDAAGVGEDVRLAVETGVAGLSIEDSTGDVSSPLYPLDTAVEKC